MKFAAQMVLSLIVLLGLALTPSESRADESCLGFKVPSKSVKVDENRYRVSLSWEKVMKYYKKTYRGVGGVKRADEMAIPGVRAVNYQNRGARGAWKGANVTDLYGQIYVFCYPQTNAKPKPSK